MPLDSRTGSVFSVLARYGGAASHPATWPDEVDRLLGDAFELEVERRRVALAAFAVSAVGRSAPGLRAVANVVARLDDDRVAGAQNGARGDRPALRRAPGQLPHRSRETALSELGQLQDEAVGCCSGCCG